MTALLLAVVTTVAPAGPPVLATHSPNWLWATACVVAFGLVVVVSRR